MTDTIAAVAGVAFPLCVGPMVEAWGLGSTGILAVALMLPPAILLVWSGPISPHAAEASAAAPAVYGG
jgi:hypothetical protein